MENVGCKREKLYAGLDSIRRPVVVEDANYNIQFMNKASIEIFGEPEGKKCYEKFRGRNTPCLVCPIEEILKKGKGELVYQAEFLGRISESHVSPFENPDGTFSIVEILTDITERKRAEESSKDSEEGFRNFFENVNDTILIIDAKTALLLDANREAERLMGRSKEEIIGMPYGELFPPGKAEYHKEKLIQSVHKERIVDFETEILRKDKTVVPVLISANLTKFRERFVIQSIFKDISGYKKAEEKITEERNKLATILANIGEGVNIVRPDYTVKYQNKFLSDRFGDLIGNKCYQGFMESQTLCEGCPIKNTIENNVTENVELKAKDGRYYELILAPLKNPDESVDALEVVRDITEKKKVQEKIAFLAGIVDHASESIIATDQEGKIIYVNPATEKMYEYKREEFIGKNVEVINAELYRERIKKEIYEAALYGEVWQGELLNPRKDGKVFYTYTTVSKMVDKNGHFIALVWFQRDISQGKRYQEEMIRIEKEKAETLRILHENETAINKSLSRAKRELMEKNLELEKRTFELEAEKKRLQGAYVKLNTMQTQLVQSEKLASLGQLAAGVAHELNNPIGFVNSNLATLGDYVKDIKMLLEKYEKMEELSEQDKSKQLGISEIEELKKQIDLAFILEDFDKIISESQEGTQRVKSIVESLRDFSRAGKGQVELADVNQGIESTLKIVWNELKYKTEMVKEYGDIPKIECFPQQLNQVFMNLLINAVQAIAEHGQIKIKTYSAGDYVVVEISDTGVGIPQENMSRIFEPFFTTKEATKGTGLGLSVVYGIIQRHRGKIEVGSEINKGTTFRLILPSTRSTSAPDSSWRMKEEKMVETNGNVKRFLD